MACLNLKSFVFLTHRCLGLLVVDVTRCICVLQSALIRMIKCPVVLQPRDFSCGTLLSTSMLSVRVSVRQLVGSRGPLYRL